MAIMRGMALLEKILVFCMLISTGLAFQPTLPRRICIRQALAPRLSATSSSSSSSNPLHRLVQLPPTPAKLKTPQFVFVGGKGGVGKTTSSAALAIALGNSGHRTLVVSTDPAHSLSDALDYTIKPGTIFPVITEPNLWALEIDVEQELAEVQTRLSGLDDATIARQLGLSPDLIASLGFSDLASLLLNPPPGIDEIIALAKLFQYAQINPTSTTSSSSSTGHSFAGNAPASFDRIVIDTAPTGHTLRLLQLPDFLSKFTQKLLSLKQRLQSMLSLFSGFLGGNKAGANTPMSGLDKLFSLVDQLSSLQQSMDRLRAVLHDQDQTQFILVTIPTVLALEESKRLLQSLRKEEILVSTVICNQVLAQSADQSYLRTRYTAQQRVLQDLHRFLPTLSSSTTSISAQTTEKKAGGIEITEVPYSATEIRSVYGLRYFSSLAHTPHPTTDPASSSRLLTIFGGKGGVGKTTSAASYAQTLSDSGLVTLVVSSDPAHSLGDALQVPLSGVPQLISDAGELWALEIDPIAAMNEFRTLLKGDDADSSSNANKKSSSSAESELDDLYQSLLSGGKGSGYGRSTVDNEGTGSSMTDDLLDMVLDADDPPPGIDEVVALTKILSYLDTGFVTKDGRKVHFDRIVLDTAPTGHTLRMLNLPQFLTQALEKVRRVRDKLGGLTGGLLGGQSGPSSAQIDRLRAFQAKMTRLESLLHDTTQCEFVVVTIATDVAMAETKRLLSSLQKEQILVRRVIVNQLLPAQSAQPKTADSDSGTNSNDFAESYLRDLRRNQQQVLTQLQTVTTQAQVPLITVPYCEHEARTVYVLRYIANFLTSSAATTSAASS